MTEGKPTLVLGGTGKTGRRVAERLASQGLPVRTATRSGPTVFDWEDRSTWAPALDGTGAIYIAYAPDLAVPGAVDTVGAFIDTALAHGVCRQVLLSGRGEEEAQRCEARLQDSGADWTVVRASWFAQNFSESMLLDPVRAGHVALPVGDVREPFVDAEDIADVAAAALTEDGHNGQLYEVTGPRLLSFAEACGKIGAAAGRPIAYEEISLDTFVAEIRSMGVPAELVDLMAYLFTTVLDGRNAWVADGVQRALGRPPRDFADYAQATAAAGAWTPPEDAVAPSGG